MVADRRRYCLQHSPVPVIVVHPSQRRLHRKHKREKDPERQSYITLLKGANQYSSSSESLVGPTHPASSDTPSSVTPNEESVQVSNVPIIVSGETIVFEHASTLMTMERSSKTEESTSVEEDKKELLPNDNG